MENRPYRQLKIPKWLIFVLLFVNPPLAFVLFVVSLIKIPYSSEELKKIRKSAVKSDEEEDADKKRKPSANGKPSVGEIVAFAVSALLAIGAVISFSTLAGAVGIGEIIRIASFLGFSGAALLTAFVIRGRRKRETRYKEWIGDADVFDINTLAFSTGVSVRKVKKDLERMAASGEFGPKAFVDPVEMLFCRTPEAAEKFKSDRARFRRGSSAENDIDEYTEILMKIRRLNDSIADPDVSAEIFKIEEQTRYIFGYVSDHPEKRSSIRTFMNYYLPTTLKLLESYAQLEKMGEGGENMQKSKEGIEGILSMLSEGFVRQTDQLFATESIDISSDIEVLETMMKKDGLAGSPDFSSGSAAAAYGEKETE